MVYEIIPTFHWVTYNDPKNSLNNPSFFHCSHTFGLNVCSGTLDSYREGSHIPYRNTFELIDAG